VPGVPAQPWDPPSEILEPRTGPRLTWDDLLDLHLELESPDWWSLPGGVPLRRPTR
jgi:hypothetical protein